jgi:hypothetical protein
MCASSSDRRVRSTLHWYGVISLNDVDGQAIVSPLDRIVSFRARLVQEFN